jgi:hypothetical protein
MEAWDRSANSRLNSGSSRCRRVQDTGPQQRSSLRYCYSARSLRHFSCSILFARSTINRRYGEAPSDFPQNITDNAKVLEIDYDIYIFWPPVTRLDLSCLLPPAILSAARTRLWTIACSLLLAPAIRHHFAASIELDNDVNTIPWLVLIKYTSVHLVAQESRHPTQLPRTARLHRSISPVGIDGVQPVYARDDPQG